MLEDNFDDLDALLNKDEPHNKRKSLGRGLGALLGDDDISEPNIDDIKITESNKISISEIVPGKYQPRTEFDKDALDALVVSVREKGVLQPLLVRKIEDKYELIAGERRWRAAKEAGLSEVPVIVKELEDKEVLEVALVENLLRENLSAIEEAEGMQRLINEFSHTQEALSQIVGKSRSHVANTLRLLHLPNSVQMLIKEGKLSAGHARALVGLENAEEIAAKIVVKDLNVRQVEDLVAKQKEKSGKIKTPKDADIIDIERDLNKNLGLRIKINPSKQGGGKVILQYSSAAELDMIIDILEKKRNNTPVVHVENPAPKQEVNEKFTIKMVD